MSFMRFWLIDYSFAFATDFCCETAVSLSVLGNSVESDVIIITLLISC